MRIVIGIASAATLLSGTCNAQENPPAAPVNQAAPMRTSKVEGIAVVKSQGNLLHGMQSDPTPWECEPTLLYAAVYPLSQRDTDFVLDFCSVLSLFKRGAVGVNFYDVTDNVTRERPKTEQKLQRYRDAKQFFLEVPNMRLDYAGRPGRYQLSWHVPKLEVLQRASYALTSQYMSELRNSKAGRPFPDRYSSAALSEDYRKTGIEFFDRKYGKGASVSLDKPLPWPTVERIAINAADDKTAYALEALTNNPPQREIDGTTFFQLDLTGNLFFGVEPAGNAVRVTPLFLEAWLYKKVVRIPLEADSYTMTCKTSGLFGKSFKCE